MSDSDFDIPSFQPYLRILARVLGSCIIGETDLQDDISWVLEAQQETALANRWIDPECVIVEAALEYCHDEQALGRVGVGELANKVSTILANRGEPTVLKPKEVGHRLRQLGICPKRDTQGYAMFLNDDMRLNIHRLARAYKVVAPEQVVATCPHCKATLAA